MTFTRLSIPDVILVEPRAFGDQRGWFLETFREETYSKNGIVGPFVQDNASYSQRGVLRGLHVQNPHPQGKLVGVLYGEVFDVAVDVRHGSPTFGQWVGEFLSAENHRQLWVPPGFAHGFMVTGETVLFAYKCTGYYSPQTEFGVRWDDPDIGIQWPTGLEAQLSAKDAAAPLLREIATDRLMFG